MNTRVLDVYIVTQRWIRNILLYVLVWGWIEHLLALPTWFCPPIDYFLVNSPTCTIIFSTFSANFELTWPDCIRCDLCKHFAANLVALKRLLQIDILQVSVLVLMYMSWVVVLVDIDMLVWNYDYFSNIFSRKFLKCNCRPCNVFILFSFCKIILRRSL